MNASDIDQSGLTDRHLIVMAECILAWARFESLFRAMLTAVEGRSLIEGARSYDRLQLTLGWTKLRQRLRDRGATPEVLERIRDLEKESGFHYEARKNISHAGCVGVRKSDPQFVVFAPFQANSDDLLELIATPLEEIERSTAWADGARGMAERILRQSGY